jgi:hypothetical protein
MRISFAARSARAGSPAAKARNRARISSRRSNAFVDGADLALDGEVNANFRPARSTGVTWRRVARSALVEIVCGEAAGISRGRGHNKRTTPPTIEAANRTAKTGRIRIRPSSIPPNKPQATVIVKTTRWREFAARSHSGAGLTSVSLRPKAPLWVMDAPVPLLRKRRSRQLLPDTSTNHRTLNSQPGTGAPRQQSIQITLLVIRA